MAAGNQGASGAPPIEQQIEWLNAIVHDGVAYAKCWLMLARLHGRVRLSGHAIDIASDADANVRANITALTDHVANHAHRTQVITELQREEAMCNDDEIALRTKQDQEFVGLLFEAKNRGLLGGVLRAIARSGIFPASQGADAALLDAWGAMRAAVLAINGSGWDAPDEVDAPHWAKYDAARAVIRQEVAETVAGAAAKLGCAILTGTTGPEVQDALLHEDLHRLAGLVETSKTSGDERLLLEAYCAARRAVPEGQHRRIFAERNLRLEALYRLPDDDGYDEASEAVNAADERLMARPAVDAEGVLVKALLIVQFIHETAPAAPSEWLAGKADAVLAEARAITGMGVIRPSKPWRV